MANSTRTDSSSDGGDVLHGATEDRSVARRPGSGRNIRLTAIFLVVSAIVFCMIVVRYRDAQRLEQSQEWAEKIQAHLQEVINGRNPLPRSLPEELIASPTPLRIPYPSPEELTRLEAQDDPFVLIASSVNGLIQPGKDGCSVILFDAGQVSAGWMSIAEVDAARERRTKLASGPATSD